MGVEGAGDGDEREVAGRTFRLHAASGAWRPLAPRPFEVVTGTDEARWYWEPSEREWISVATAPRVGEPPGFVLRSIWSGDG